ncbi:MAG: MFS transporter [Thermoguttaceae bacterium]
MDARSMYLRTRLSLMMFLQFFIWGAWWVAVAGYANGLPTIGGLPEGGTLVGLIVATIPLGAIISPLFVGYVADRLFATQHLLSALHAVGAVCLILAGFQTQFIWLFLFLILHTLCFMPALALCNSLAFRNIDDPNKFPRIAMFGTIGWIVAGLIVGIFLGERNPYFFYLAGLVEILQAAYCVTLPHTPPKPRSEWTTDVFGFGALKLLKEPSFLVFVLGAFLIVIPTGFYFTGCNPMLVETERPGPTALMTLGQVTEVCVMFTMPAFIAALGLKTILALGMLTWAFRYLLLATGAFSLILLAILVHGFAYCFVFVGAYIFVDKRAPRDLRASAQSLIAFLMLGVGFLLGMVLAGDAMRYYRAEVSTVAATKETPEGKEDVAQAALPLWRHLAQVDENDDGRITLAEITKLGPEGLQIQVKKWFGLKVEKWTYSTQDLARVLQAADDLRPIRTRGDFRSAMAKEIGVSRQDWLRAKSHRWGPYWLWPALAAAVIGILYWFASLGTPEPAEQPAGAPPAEKPQAEPPPVPPQAPPPGESPPPPVSPA